MFHLQSFLIFTFSYFLIFRVEWNLTAYLVKYSGPHFTDEEDEAQNGETEI